MVLEMAARTSPWTCPRWHRDVSLSRWASRLQSPLVRLHRPVQRGPLFLRRGRSGPALSFAPILSEVADPMALPSLWGQTASERARHPLSLRAYFPGQGDASVDVCSVEGGGPGN